jgi:serine protease Do
MFPVGFGEVAERLRRSTVHIGSGGRGHGSGIIVKSGANSAPKSDAVIVTNAHVAAVGPPAVTLWDGRSFQARIDALDRRRDLALLRIPASDSDELPAAALGDSNRLRPGELVIAIGNPLGFMGALTAGIVHAVGPLPGLGPRKWIQAGVRLAPGNSGGPLADAAGTVVGVNTMVAGRLGLAVPSNEVTRLLSGNQPQLLGVVLQPVPLSIEGRERLGLRIVEILPDSAASRASLLPGDILVGIGGRPLGSLDDLEEALQAPSESVLSLQFVRADLNKIRTVAVRLAMSNPVAA